VAAVDSQIKREEDTIMSTGTWKTEFYKTDANKPMTDYEALVHSLTKWKGLLGENLSRHGMVFDGGGISECGFTGEHFSVDSSTCALCAKHLKVNTCPTCPLTAVRGMPCDRTDSDKRSPYYRFLNNGDPLPMIQLLEDALRNISFAPQPAEISIQPVTEYDITVHIAIGPYASTAKDIASAIDDYLKHRFQWYPEEMLSYSIFPPVQTQHSTDTFDEWNW
jgi:hypothetical protein